MTSKRLFANLFKENIKRRLWPIALSIVANFFAQIVFAVLMIGQYSDRLYRENTTLWEVKVDYFRRVAGMDSVPVYIIVMWLSMVIALQGYHYLFDLRQTDLYYSLPVKRVKYYDVFNLVGIVIFAVPYIIGHIITVIIGISRGYVEVGLLGLYFASALVVLLEYTFFYEICVLAAVLTGHVVVAVLGCGIFFLFGPIVSLIKELLMQTFMCSYLTGEGSYRSTLFDYSPYALTAKLNDLMSNSYENAIILNLRSSFVTLLIIILITALAFVLGRVLINKRPAEAAGKAMAFNITKPVIKVAMLVASGLGSGLTMYYISQIKSVGIFVFGMVCGLVIVHFVIETIYEFDFKASFGHYGSFAVGAGITAAIFLALLLDPLGYESWQPMPDKVESVAIYDDLTYTGMTCPNYRVNDDVSESAQYYNVGVDEFVFKEMKLTDMENVEKLTRQGAINARETHRMALSTPGDFVLGDNIYTNDVENDDYRFTNVTLYVQWNMKNGRKIRRHYEINISTDELVKAYSAIYNSDEYKYGKFPVLTMNPEEINKISCNTLKEDFEKKLGEDKMAEFIKLYKSELLAQNFEDITSELPTIQLSGIRSRGQDVFGDEYIYDFYIFPSFAKTNEFLKENGIPVSWREGEELVKKATLTVEIWEEDGEFSHDEEWTTTDAEEMSTVFGCMAPYELFNINQRIVCGNKDGTYEEECFSGTTLSVDIDGDGGENITNSRGVTVIYTDELPDDLKKLMFPNNVSEKSSSVNISNVGWTRCVSNG